MECGGPRVSDLNPPHSAGSGGVNRLPPRIMAKTFLSRNLAFLLAARRPPHSTTDWCYRLLFCLLFFDRFSEGIFFIFPYLWLPLGTPKIIKNRQKSTSEAFFFRSLCISCIFNTFGENESFSQKCIKCRQKGTSNVFGLFLAAKELFFYEFIIWNYIKIHLIFSQNFLHIFL